MQRVQANRVGETLPEHKNAFGTYGPMARAVLLDELAGTAWLYGALDDTLVSWLVLVVKEHEEQYRVHVEQHILPETYPSREAALDAGLQSLARRAHRRGPALSPSSPEVK